MSKPGIEAFIEQANLHHPTIEFTAETHFKQTETFLHTHFTSCHPPSVKKGFVKGEALRILRKNSSEKTFEEKFKTKNA